MSSIGYSNTEQQTAQEAIIQGAKPPTLALPSPSRAHILQQAQQMMAGHARSPRVNHSMVSPHKADKMDGNGGVPTMVPQMPPIHDQQYQPSGPSLS